MVRALRRTLGLMEDSDQRSIGTQTIATREDWQMDPGRRLPDPMRELVCKVAVTNLGTFRNVIPIIRSVQVAMRMEALHEDAGDGHETTIRCMKEVRRSPLSRVCCAVSTCDIYI